MVKKTINIGEKEFLSILFMGAFMQEIGLDVNKIEQKRA